MTARRPRSARGSSGFVLALAWLTSFCALAEEPAQLLGSATRELTPATVEAGLVVSHPVIARSEGVARFLHFWVENAEPGASVALGVYSDDSLNNRPAALLTSCQLGGADAGGWNDCRVADTAVSSGGKYWLAMLSVGGALEFRHTLAGAAPGKSELASALPAQWSGAQVADAGQISFYATAEQLTFVTPARTFVVDTCPGPAGGVVIQLEDGRGNAAVAPAGGRAFALVSDSAGPPQFFADSLCATPIDASALVIPEGSSSLEVFYRDSTPGAPVFELRSDAGVVLGPPQVQSVLALPMPKLGFVSPPQRLPKYQCSAAVFVQTQDATGNPQLLGKEVTAQLASSSPDVKFYVDSLCKLERATLLLPQSDGTGRFFFISSQAGKVELTATAEGLTSAAQSQTLNEAEALCPAAAPDCVVELAPGRSRGCHCGAVGGMEALCALLALAALARRRRA